VTTAGWEQQQQWLVLLVKPVQLRMHSALLLPACWYHSQLS
jgi:hypothetical protein